MVELKLAGVPKGKLVLTLNALDFDTTSSVEQQRVLGKLRVTIVAARNLIPMDKGGSSDPFVTLKIQDKTRLKRTTIKKKTLDPTWGEVRVPTLVFSPLPPPPAVCCC